MVENHRVAVMANDPTHGPVGTYLKYIDQGISHPDYCLIDGKPSMIGEKGSLWAREDLVAGTVITDWTVGWSMNSAHTSTRCIDDTWENYPGVRSGVPGSPNGGGGSTVGQRYAMTSGSGSTVGHSYVAATRLGKNDRGVIRFIVGMRSFKRGQGSEDHPAVAPDFEYVAFNSNWQEADPSQGDEHVQTYVVLIPDAWRSPHNSGAAI